MAMFSTTTMNLYEIFSVNNVSLSLSIFTLGPSSCHWVAHHTFNTRLLIKYCLKTGLKSLEHHRIVSSNPVDADSDQHSKTVTETFMEMTFLNTRWCRTLFHLFSLFMGAHFPILAWTTAAFHCWQVAVVKGLKMVLWSFSFWAMQREKRKWKQISS